MGTKVVRTRFRWPKRPFVGWGLGGPAAVLEPRGRRCQRPVTDHRSPKAAIGRHCRHRPSGQAIDRIFSADCGRHDLALPFTRSSHVLQHCRALRESRGDARFDDLEIERATGGEIGAPEGHRQAIFDGALYSSRPRHAGHITAVIVAVAMRTARSAATLKRARTRIGAADRLTDSQTASRDSAPGPLIQSWPTSLTAHRP
jgi:hypothetical protein